MINWEYVEWKIVHECYGCYVIPRDFSDRDAQHEQLFAELRGWGD